MAKNPEDVALEIYQSVEQSSDKQKKLKASTFWRLFGVKSRQPTKVQKIVRLLGDQGLKVAVKSGKALGDEGDDDWIILTLTFVPPPKPLVPPLSIQWPSPEWFDEMQQRGFESEREVETFFVSPLLDKLGYKYDDIYMGYPVKMFKGVQKTTKEADVVVFNGPGRGKKDVLLLIEAKKSDKGISVDQIGQAKSYAQELLPACYIVSDGQQIKVFQFNGMLVPDECVMDFARLELKERWEALYKYVSKEATIKRKQWMEDQISRAKSSPTVS